MARTIRRGVRTALWGLSVAALATAPMGVTTIVAPAVNAACQPGETGVTNGCAPFCVPGRHLDTATGLCLKDPPANTPPAHQVQ